MLETSAQGLWRSIMRLLADNGVRGEFGRTREMSPLLRRHLQTHATRALPYARPAPLIQASFCYFVWAGSSARRHAQRGQGGFDGFVAEPCFLQPLDAVGFFLCGRLRYPVIGSDHVV